MNYKRETTSILALLSIVLLAGCVEMSADKIAEEKVKWTFI